MSTGTEYGDETEDYIVYVERLEITDSLLQRYGA